MNAIGPKPFATRVPAVATPRPAGAPGRAATDEATTAAPARPPAGEATLWDVLTPEEREFFAQQTALGPLTYRPDGAARAGAPAPTGRRIDVKG